MRVSSSKTLGRDFEREVASIFRVLGASVEHDVALDRLRCGTGQRIERNLVAVHPLVWRQTVRQPFQLEAQQIANVDDLPLAHQVHVGNDDGVASFGGGTSGIGQIQDADLLDEWRAAVMRFDLFRHVPLCQGVVVSESIR